MRNGREAISAGSKTSREWMKIGYRKKNMYCADESG
jgi:hypothetical protein